MNISLMSKFTGWVRDKFSDLTEETMTHIILITVIAVVLIFIAGAVLAGGSVHHNTTNHYMTNSKMINSYGGLGALAIAASQINHHDDAPELQIGIGLGTHEDHSAGIVSVAQRVFNKTTLVSGSIGVIEDGKPAIGLGLNFRLK